MPFTIKDHTLAAVLKPVDFYLFLPQLEDPYGAERDAGDGWVAPQLRVIFALLDPDPDSEYGSGPTGLTESGSKTMLNSRQIFTFFFLNSKTLTAPSGYYSLNNKYARH